MKRFFLHITFTIAIANAFSNRGKADLIINGNFEAGNSGFSVSNNYTQQQSGYHNPGHYGLISNPATAYSNGDVSFGDHTTGSGLMLFVDASTIASSAFWSEIITVTPNTYYLFSGFATASVSASPPNIRLLVNSTSVGPDYNVNGSVPGNWQNFKETFSSGGNSTIVLSLFDTNTTQSGNDFAIDDLSLNPTASVPEPNPLVLAVAAALIVFASVSLRQKATHRRPVT